MQDITEAVKELKFSPSVPVHVLLPHCFRTLMMVSLRVKGKREGMRKKSASSFTK